MSGAMTFVVTIAVAGGVLVVFFVIYYLGTIANSIYETKVGLKKEFDQKVEEMKKFVDKELQQRTLWMRSEVQEEAAKVRMEIAKLVDEQRVATNRTLDSLQGQFAQIQTGLAAFEAARAAEAERAKPLLGRAGRTTAKPTAASATPEPAEPTEPGGSAKPAA